MGYFHYHFTFPSLGRNYIWMFPFSSSPPFKLFQCKCPRIPSDFSSYMCSWKGPRQDAGEEISRSKFGRNRRSTCSDSVVLGRHRNVSVTYVVNTLWTAMSWVCQWFPNSVSSSFQWQQLFPASRRCSGIIPLVSTSEKTQVWLSHHPLPLRPDHSPHRKHS